MRSLRRKAEQALSLAPGKSKALTLSIIVMLPIALSVYRQPEFIWSEPGPWHVLGALFSLALLKSRLPPLASLFFLLGIGSLLWTLTPANTMLNSLWELIYLAALVVGQSTVGFALVNAALLFAGLERTLLLDLFSLTEYFSGSAHYLAGAQALLFLPLCLSTATLSTRWPNRIVATLASAACLLLILNSGARSVYLPALVVIPLSVLRLALPQGKRLRAIAIPSMALALVLALAVVLPGPTVMVPLQAKAVDVNAEILMPAHEEAPAVAAAPVGVVEEGGIASRLKMWEQTLHIGLSNPLGTGAGSFRNTIHAFQEHPLIGFSSAHNVFLEVFATGGWPRLIVLVLLIAVALLKGWRGSRWPIAIGSAGLWASMGFDITYQMPGIMILAFWSLGTSRGEVTIQPQGWRQLQSVLAVVVLIVSAGTALWWFAPCSGVDCALHRHFGYRREVLALAQSLDYEQTRRLAERAVQLNPESLWAWRLKADQAAGPEERLTAARGIAMKFPLTSPDIYLSWAEAALASNEPGEAREAIRAGLEVFPPGFSPAGVPRGGRAAGYQAWLNEATRILAGTEPDQ